MWYTRSIHWCIHRCTDPQRSDHFVTLQVLNQENAELRAHLDMLKIRQLFKSECPAQWKGCCCSAYICCFDHLYDRFTTCMVVSYWLIQFFQLLDQSTARDVVERNPFYLQHKGSNRAAAQRSHPAVVLTRRVEEHQPEHSPMAQLTRRAEHYFVPGLQMHWGRRHVCKSPLETMTCKIRITFPCLTMDSFSLSCCKDTRKTWIQFHDTSKMLHPREKSRQRTLKAVVMSCTHFSVCALKSNLALAGLI